MAGTGSTLARVGSMLWRGLRFTGRVAVEGLTHIGFAYAVMPPGYFAAIRAGKQAQAGARWDDAADDALPPGHIRYVDHPERLVDRPLTPLEEGLWAQLVDPGRLRPGRPADPPTERERHAE